MRLIMARVLWSFDLEMEADSIDWYHTQSIFSFWQKPAHNVRLIPRRFDPEEASILKSS